MLALAAHYRSHLRDGRQETNQPVVRLQSLLSITRRFSQLLIFVTASVQTLFLNCEARSTVNASRWGSDRVRHQLSRRRSGRLGREHRYVHPLALERLDFHLAEFHYASVVRDALCPVHPKSDISETMPVKWPLPHPERNDEQQLIHVVARCKAEQTTQFRSAQLAPACQMAGAFSVGRCCKANVN